MKAKDLMIGDYIMFNNNTYIIEEISKKGWAHLIDNDGSECHVELSSDYILDAITPIPLTEEILEKNGFKYKEADETCATEAFHQWHLDGSRFALDDDSWWRSVKDGELHVKFGGFPLKFVHELQHALRLAGIYKEIEL